jgi:alanine racemase
MFARTKGIACAQGGGYGHGVVTAAKAFLEGGFAEVGVGTLNEALALRAAGVSAPVHLCYQPDIQSAPAVAHAPDVQARPKHCSPRQR